MPPVSWRAAGVVLGILLLAGVAALALVRPAVQDEKERTRAGERAARGELVRRETARLRRASRPRFGRGTGAARTLTGRRRLARSLERAITRDARARVLRRQLAGPILSTRCEHSGDTEADPGARLGVYKCTAIRGRIRGVGGVPALKGHPFVATVDYSRGRFAWCKYSPQPGEKGKGLARVKLPRVCAGRLREVL